ncbi:MAG: SlyX protein [Desulfuromonas sp.]|nr:MAG: SlyX protein [Desulfuromonas sp.]
MANELDERLTELEMRFTHQALQLDELNQEVIACHEKIARLERDNRAYREMLQSLAPEMRESPDE